MLAFLRKPLTKKSREAEEAKANLADRMHTAFTLEIREQVKAATEVVKKLQERAEEEPSCRLVRVPR